VSEQLNVRKTLVDADQSVVIVIDIQDHFLDKYENSISQALVERVGWFLQFARAMNVPIVAMAEDINNARNLTKPILDALPKDAVVFNKNAFGLAHNPQILAAVESTGRKVAVLVGVETDVCVAHSALGLMGHDYQVVVLKDGVATTAGDDEIGLRRMHDAGALISSIKAIHYEWLRSVTSTDELYEKAPELKIQTPKHLLL